jgi:TolA-binding protein
MCVAIILAALYPASPAGSKEKKSDAEKSKALSELGMEFEWARLRPLADRQIGLGAVAAAMAELMSDDIPKKRRSAAHFLAGEINFAIGEHGAATEQFRKAAKEGKNGDFADDAAFAAIISLEAEGKDKDAAKAWNKWEKRYKNSPLLPEALLAKTWNALRRDSIREASQTMKRLRTEFPLMEKNQRVIVTVATVDYIQGRSDEAITVLAGADNGVAPTYLRALCLEEKGQMLKAAAQYQEVSERFAHSALHDHAMLAKANIFLKSGAYKSAAEEFGLVVERAHRPNVRAEAELRQAACVFLDGDAVAGTDLLRVVAQQYHGSGVAARAQLLLGEVLVSQQLYEEAILEFNRVLTEYFEHELAASAQYRVGRCLDALGRHNEATTAYKLVVSGYPLAPQSPAAAYLAGVGLLEEDRPQAAVPYFQLVLDRYAGDPQKGALVFASPERQELVEAALCLLELSYHRAGNLGQLSGVPHLMLQKMPPSSSPWRAYALLIDADALAAQARYQEAEAMLETLIKEFPEHEVGISANRLLAWTYAQQGKDDLAIVTEERMLARYASQGDTDNLSSAYLNKAHILFNRKQYDEAANTYDDFLQRFPGHPQRLLALYQSGLCHLRLQNTGNAVDRWEELIVTDPSAEIAERAWVRAGDLYFQAEHYDNAKRCYQGLLDNFATSRGAALGMLRLAQCDYNAGRDADALGLYSAVVERFPGTGVAREAERGMERALYRLGQRDDGVEVLAELVERYPASSFAADAQFEIAMRRYDAKQFIEAADEFRRVISQFPSFSSADKAHFLMADSYTEAASHADARQAYEQFLMFFPESELRTTVRFRLGSLRFDEGDYMRAAIDFSTVLEEKTSEEIAAASLFNMALCRRMLGETEPAQTALERYRELYAADQRAADVAYQLGDIHDAAGRTEMAAKEYRKALKAKPDKALATELHYRLGVCHETLADDTAAIKAYKKAIAATDKSDAFRLSAVARCAALYEKAEEYKKALSAYRDLIKNAKDPELVVAAKERVSQLEAVVK